MNSYLKFKTVEEGELLIHVLKLHYNTYFLPVDYELISAIKERIKKLKAPKVRLKNFQPLCISDFKNPKCKAFVRIYKMGSEFKLETITKKGIIFRKGYDAKFIEEVECNVIEWYQGDYRITFKNININYPDKVKYLRSFDNFIYVLKFRVEKGFISNCK